MNFLRALKMTCHEATYFHQKKKEGQITFTENVGLWFHLQICRFCNLFFKQVEQLESASKYEAVNSDNKFVMDKARKAELKQRLSNELENE
jgi:hypothetical protein